MNSHAHKRFYSWFCKVVNGIQNWTFYILSKLVCLSITYYKGLLKIPYTQPQETNCPSKYNKFTQNIYENSTTVLLYHSKQSVLVSLERKSFPRQSLVSNQVKCSDKNHVYLKI